MSIADEILHFGLLPAVDACINPCSEVVLSEGSILARLDAEGGFEADYPVVWKGLAGEMEYTVQSIWTDGVEFDPWGDTVCRYTFPAEPTFSEETCETVHNLMSAPVAWDPHSGLEDPRS